MVSVVTFLILSASFMGFITAGGLYYSPDEFPDYDEIKIQLIIKNQTSSIEDAEIYVNGILKEQKYLGNGSYEIFLKPGRHDFRVVATNHTTANMEVYIPPQDNNLSLVDYEKGLQGLNLIVINLEEGNSKIITIIKQNMLYFFISSKLKSEIFTSKLQILLRSLS